MTLNELDLLKKQADTLGITYKSNIGVEALKAKINAKLNDDDSGSEDEGDEDAPTAAKPAKKLTKIEQEQEIRDTQQRDMLALVRVRISCLNPMKAALQGEIVTVANRYVGTVRKFIPFGEASDGGYHIPRILLDELKSRKFNSVKTKKGDNGQLLPVQRLVPEFAIEELEPLTPAELAKLAAAQQASAGLD